VILISYGRGWPLQGGCPRKRRGAMAKKAKKAKKTKKVKKARRKK